MPTILDSTYKHAYKKLRNLRAMHNGGKFIESRARALSGRTVPVFRISQLDNIDMARLTKPCSASQIYAVSLLSCKFSSGFLRTQSVTTVRAYKYYMFF